LNKKKVFLIIPSLHRGGAERVTSILASNLNNKLFDVTLVLLEKRGSYLNDLKDDVKILDLNIKSVKKSILPLIMLINKEKPDLVYSTLGHLNLMLMMARFLMPKKTKFVGREASIPSILNENEKYPKIFNYLYRRLYPKFNKIICQSNFMKNDLIENFNINSGNLEVINNPLDFAKIKKKVNENNKNHLFDKNKKNIVAIGSLEHVKGYDMLMKAMSKITRDDICLYIIGTGKLENKLNDLIIELNLKERVKLLGFKENPYVYMREADFGILSSRYEGFPNTVLETLACGTPVIAFKCPGGVEEIIIESINGYFVEAGNIDQLANTIESKIDNQLLPQVIVDSVYDRYNLQYIIRKYDNLFKDIINDN